MHRLVGAFILTAAAIAGVVPAAASPVPGQPVRAPRATAKMPVQRLAAGSFHTCAVTKIARVKCWGSNHWGQLGDGTKIPRSRPVLVHGLTHVVAVAAGEVHSCALQDTGVVWCWGGNSPGQVGVPKPVEVLTPVAVKGLTRAVGVSASGESSCAILENRTVKCWGSNYNGQLGIGRTGTFHRSPVATQRINNAVAVSGGGSHRCALLQTGTVKCWGFNYNGEVGDGSTKNYRTRPVGVVGLTNVVAIAAGQDHTCAATAGGGARCWGGNEDDHGSLGNGTTTNSPRPVAVKNLSGVVRLAAGAEHSCAVLRNGSARCWGWNSYGQLGNDAYEDSLVPVAVKGLTGAVEMSAGYEHTCARLKTGRIMCWGDNYQGRLGNGSTIASFTPVVVKGF